jgi:uncharacterized membrane protein
VGFFLGLRLDFLGALFICNEIMCIHTSEIEFVSVAIQFEKEIWILLRIVVGLILSLFLLRVL